MAGINIIDFAAEATEDGELNNLKIIRALENHVIVDNILFYLPISDILQCSLVDKSLWKISRRYLRVHKRLIINLKSNVCSMLVKLNEVLKFVTDFPFVGLNLEFNPNYDCCKRINARQISDVDVEALYPHIFKKLPLQYLYITFPTEKNCLGEKLLQKLLTASAPSRTEYLELIKWPKSIPSAWDYLSINPENSKNAMVSSFNQSSWLKNLKVIRRRMPDPGRLIFEIVSSSPELKEFLGPLPWWALPVSRFRSRDDFDYLNEKNDFPESKYHTVRDVVATYCEKIISLAKARPKLHFFSLIPCISCSKDTKNQHMAPHRALTSIVYDSRHSLQILKFVCSAYLLPYCINKDIGPLVNLRQLQAVIRPYLREFTETMLFLGSMDFQSIAPNLTYVGLKVDYIYQNEPTCHPLEVAKLVNSSRFNLNVTTLEVLVLLSATTNQKVNIFSALADIFPNIQNLITWENCESATFSDCMNRIALQWKRNLKSVSCSYYRQKRRGKSMLQFVTELLEETCCNISSQELMGMKYFDEQLQSWNFAPTKLAICLDYEITRLKVTLPNKKPSCGRCVNQIWQDRYNRISSWIKVKLPNFSLQLDLFQCSQDCNPFPFHAGKTQSFLDKLDQMDRLCGFEKHFTTWILNF